jgi:hypothetical protein
MMAILLEGITGATMRVMICMVVQVKINQEAME